MPKLSPICQKIINAGFGILFFLVPLAISPYSFELFEFSKMFLTYLLTIIIVSAWVIRMIAERKFLLRRTFWNIPLLCFLVSQFLSFLFSINHHTSFWGYYSRSNGGLASYISYSLLFWAFVNNIDTKKARQCLNALLASAAIVSGYGIAEHFGIDANFWVQDVKARVFSTLGQPNWLATWLVAITPLTWATYNLQLTTNNLGYKKRRPISFVVCCLLFVVFLICLLFTKSRSGIFAFTVSYVIFWGLMLIKEKQMAIKSFLSFSVITGFIVLIVGTPWTKSLGQFTKDQSAYVPTSYPLPPTSTNPISIGGTESGDIRKIVWKGAIKIWKHYPLLGTGPETFAYSYYWFRPREHNDTSEWDFVYNKAHNEYLNFAANTGALGLGSYLLLIGSFIFWSIKKLKTQMSNVKTKTQNLKSKRFDMPDLGLRFEILHLSLLSGFIGILIANFFGFSVVPVNLLFFLFPAIGFVLVAHDDDLKKVQKPPAKESTLIRELAAFSVFVFTLVGITFPIRFWIADIKYAAADRIESQSPDLALDYCQSAVKLRPDEPWFHNGLAIAAASLAEKFNKEDDAAQTEKMVKIAISESEKVVTANPYNVNFWKDRSRIFYDLAKTDSRYSAVAINSLITAGKLAPTDAKIPYSLGLIYTSLGEEELGQKALEETIILKPNYDHAHYALALIYESRGEKKKAIEQLEYIIQKITPNYAPAIKELKRITNIK